MNRAVYAFALVLMSCGSCGGGSSTQDAALGNCTEAPAMKSGQGTYYDADGSGNCSFDPSPADLMVAAINAPDYDRAAWCGACLEVTGPSGTVTVRVVDQCPGCAAGDLDLSREAFTLISPLSAGRVPITWRSVACNVAGPIAYHFKDGSNAFWTAIQVRNHRYPIAKLEVVDGTSTNDLGRVDYNYFIETAGLGAGPYSLRVTDTRGHVVEDTGITLGDAVTRAGMAQFPACP